MSVSSLWATIIQYILSNCVDQFTSANIINLNFVNTQFLQSTATQHYNIIVFVHFPTTKTNPFAWTKESTSLTNPIVTKELLTFEIIIDVFDPEGDWIVCRDN